MNAQQQSHQQQRPSQEQQPLQQQPPQQQPLQQQPLQQQLLQQPLQQQQPFPQQPQQASYQSAYPQYAPPPPDWYGFMQEMRSWMTNLNNKVTRIESSVARIKAEQSAQNLVVTQQQQRFVQEDPLLDVSQDNELYKRLADYRIPVAGIIRKPDVSKITQGHVRKHFIGEVLQLTGSNEEAMMDSMIKMTEVFRDRLLAVWDARPNKKNNTFRGFTEAARDKLATDISVFLKRRLDDIPIDMCEKNWVSLYLVYHLFEKYISTSQRY
ncbi:hypothetical protein INT45_000795 [Circinella minor]|uniref:Uncharacterized protein n=1 Tax=Circinella minor TaxID=1195481 RepID=A0A8H7RVZ0_9FUNG|nr:hypothetical protein INT45_000795 [Circinella minor]